MATAKPFTWVVRFTVAPLWVADGFSISDERAEEILRRALQCATEGEYSACVLEAPSALHIARVQGYVPRHPAAGKAARELMQGVKNSGQIHAALIAARRLLDSVAFVANEGDTAPVLEKIDAALAAIDARQGEPMQFD